MYHNVFYPCFTQAAGCTDPDIIWPKRTPKATYFCRFECPFAWGHVFSFHVLGCVSRTKLDDCCASEQPRMTCRKYNWLPWSKQRWKLTADWDLNWLVKYAFSKQLKKMSMGEDNSTCGNTIQHMCTHTRFAVHHGGHDIYLCTTFLWVPSNCGNTWTICLQKVIKKITSQNDQQNIIE